MSKRSNKAKAKRSTVLVVKKGRNYKPIRHREAMRVFRPNLAKAEVKKPTQVFPAVQNVNSVTKSSKKLVKIYKDAIRDCKKRKVYKKEMLRKVAAQVKAGGGSMKEWRKERAAKRKTVWEC